MVLFLGKCAGCGVGKNHKNFKGRRDGRPIPDPCYIELRKRRKAIDDRICSRCYEAHLANIPKEPKMPATDNAKRSRSRTSSLDGVAWSDTASERVSKMARRSLEGDRLIPLDLHEKKLAEQAAALRRESAQLLQLNLERLEEVELQDAVASIFRRGDVSAADLGRIFQRVVEYYKQGPSAERAQLLRDLSNEQASRVAGISSRTMAKARSGEFGEKSTVKRARMTNSGISMERVRQIAHEAVFNPRYCEVRGWSSFVGGRQVPHWECVGLVDVKTIWINLCKEHGEFCSLRTFYNVLPDFYVPKKKERCVCSHCKQGRRVLDDTAVVLNALRRTVNPNSQLKLNLDILRGDLLDLYGHLDKEIVIDVADGRHHASGDGCAKCELLNSIPRRLREYLPQVARKLSISPQDWAVVFPGVELPEDKVGRLEKVQTFVDEWPIKVGKLVSHLLLKADRIRAVEADIEALRNVPDSEVWFADYSMPVKLVGTFDETEADFLSNDLANNLGFMRMYMDGGTLYREYWDFVFTGSKDMQSSLQIQECFFLKIQEDRAKRGLPPLHCLKIWADNASDFKGGDMWAQWRKELGEGGVASELSMVELNYHAPGEGKTMLDGHFGHLKMLRHKRERMKVERRSVEDLLVSMATAEATHVVHVELDRGAESRFYMTTKGIDDLHRVVVTRDGLQAQKKSDELLKDLELDQVKERQTKHARKIRERVHGTQTHEAKVDECQKCFQQVGPDEDVAEWIQCEDCDRSWHKTCVGIDAATPLDEVEWKKCSACGGADPEGEMLVKRRKVSLCRVCGKRVRDGNHKACKQAKEQEVAAFRTPPAVIMSKREHPSVLRKIFVPSTEKRAGRKGRKKRKHKSTVVSTEAMADLKRRI
jgi:hypothetical protein